MEEELGSEILTKDFILCLVARVDRNLCPAVRILVFYTQNRYRATPSINLQPETTCTCTVQVAADMVIGTRVWMVRMEGVF